MFSTLLIWLDVARDWAVEHGVPLVFGEGWIGYTPRDGRFEEGPVGAEFCRPAIAESIRVGACGTIVCSNAAPQHAMWSDVGLQRQCNAAFLARPRSPASLQSLTEPPRARTGNQYHRTTTTFKGEHDMYIHSVPPMGSPGGACSSAVRRSAVPPSSAAVSVAAVQAQRHRPSPEEDAPLTLQSALADPKPKAALEEVMKAYTKYPTTLNTVAIPNSSARSCPRTSRAPTHPDVLTWYAGSVARDYASKGLLLDVSDMWTGSGAWAKFSPALKSPVERQRAASRSSCRRTTTGGASSTGSRPSPSGA